jgi:hypothetical protein
MMARRDQWILAVTALCAVGVPLTAAAWVSARTGALAAHLGAAAGVPARIGAIDADLTGTIRLSGLALGQLVTADSLEASVALGSLLAGTLRADEIRVAGPRVAVQVDGDGDSDLGRVARRLAGRGRTTTGAGGGRLRRIVVSSGTLSAQIAGLGALAAERVELVPDAGGVRVITGPVRLRGRNGALAVDLAFARSAAELALPHLRVGRVLAVGGAGDLVVSAAPAGAGRVPVRDLAIGRLADGGSLELRASVDDGGIARPLAVDVAPRARAIDRAIDSPDLAISIRGERIPLGALAALAPRSVDVSRAHATGSLAVRRDAARTVVEIDGAIDGAALDHRILAPVAIPLAAAVHGAIAISPDAIALSGATVELGAARWTASGWLRRGNPTAGQLDLALATAPCSELLASLPAELRGPLDGIVLTGSFGGRVRLAVDLAAPAGEGVGLTTSITDGCRTEAEPPAADVGRLAVASEQVFADGSRARVGKGERGWTSLRQLPGFVARAYVSAEDARFYDHAGFDLVQIGKSLEIDLREHRLARGGSTISQQLIKNAFLSQRRSFDRKLQEAILTWRLESRLGKHQILERYLNIIELGPRIFGIGAAARYWFDVAPHELTLRQAAFLAALTSEPTSMSRRVRRAGGLDLESDSRVDIVLGAMYRDGVIDAAQLEVARSAALRFAPAALKQER